MGDIVNLRQVRKKRAKQAADAAAEANRAKFGRTKAEKQLTRLEDQLKTRHLDGHRLSQSDAADEKDPA